MRIMFTGGGTGGHIFPAIAVAERVRDMVPDCDILFLGTKDKIEGKVVPAAGFKFKSIWISGFARKSIKENLLFPVKLVVSIIQSIVIAMKFKPQAIVATGGYVSGPSVKRAHIMGAKVFLIEPNSYPGITTRFLEKKATEIHLMFKDAASFLRMKERIFVTGNPVRKSLTAVSREQSRKKLGIGLDRKVLLVMGGSLGAKAINNTVAASLQKLKEAGIFLLWQTGASSFEEYRKYESDDVMVLSFIDDVNEVYAAADLVTARAGATTIAELIYLRKPAILVPFPYAAENHQYKNARSMSNEGAAVLIEEKEISLRLADEIANLISATGRLEEIKKNQERIGGIDAAKEIAGRVVNACRSGII